jgi:hypothetical protein
MRGHQQDAREHNEYGYMCEQETSWRFHHRKSHTGTVKLPLQRVKLNNHLLYFKNDRTDQREVAGTILANERFIFDGFSAKRAFHYGFGPGG